MRKVFMPFFLVIMLIPAYSQDYNDVDPVTARIRNFEDLVTFLEASELGFTYYFRRYNPRTVSKSENEIIMSAKYGRYTITCIFTLDKNQGHIVKLYTKFDRDRIKWLNNIVKHVEIRR
jgi:hypothetical protein